jgi:hypothetical protein
MQFWPVLGRRVDGRPQSRPSATYLTLLLAWARSCNLKKGLRMWNGGLRDLRERTGGVQLKFGTVCLHVVREWIICQKLLLSNVGLGVELSMDIEEGAGTALIGKRSAVLGRSVSAAAGRPASQDQLINCPRCPGFMGFQCYLHTENEPTKTLKSINSSLILPL